MNQEPYPAPTDLEFDDDFDLEGLQELLKEHSPSTRNEKSSPAEKTGYRSQASKSPSARKAVCSRKTVLLCAAAMGAVLVCVLAGIFIGRMLDPYDNRILPNTTIGGIEVGGMTRSEAGKALKQAVSGTLCLHPMEVILPNGTISLSPEETRVSLNVRSAAAAAFRLGRKGTDAEKQLAVDVSAAAGNQLELLPHLKIDENAIRAKLEAYAAEHNTVHTELSYKLCGTAPALEEDRYDDAAPGQILELTLGTPLQQLDVDEVLTQILQAYSQNATSITIHEVDSQTAPKAPDLDAIYNEFYTAPVSTTLDMTTYQQVPGKFGYAPDLEQARNLLAAARPGETISIPMTAIRPEILGDEVYFRDELGYCETKHTNNEDRNTNLKLACAALDGLILQPGDIFSYNDTLGERTEEKGYKPAAAYSGTATVNSIGGGVCQGATTLYYAALLADMEIVFRINHGFRSSYIGVGLDATVNWGGPDFQFRNNFNFPVMIKAEVSDGYMKIRLLGTDEKDYYVKMTSGYSEDESFVYAWSYKSKFDKETDELISKEKEAYSCYMK